MARWLRVAVVTMVAGAGSVACLPATPPPPSYQAPVVDAVTITPVSPHPGDVVTIALQVHDDEIISSVDAHGLIVPSGVAYPVSTACSSAMTPGIDAAHATVTLTCALPSFASNGTWKADLTVYDVAEPGFNYVGLRTFPSFEVTGGVDDQSPPTLVSYQTNPTVIGQTTEFTFTMRVHDDAPVTLPYVGYVVIQELGPFVVVPDYVFRKPFSDSRSELACHDPVYSTVPSTTDTVITQTCTPSSPGVAGTADTGLYRAQMPLMDGLGQADTAEMYLQVT